MLIVVVVDVLWAFHVSVAFWANLGPCVCHLNPSELAIPSPETSTLTFIEVILQYDCHHSSAGKSIDNIHRI